jgi:hypothetical protein
MPQSSAARKGLPRVRHGFMPFRVPPVPAPAAHGRRIGMRRASKFSKVDTPASRAVPERAPARSTSSTVPRQSSVPPSRSGDDRSTWTPRTANCVIRGDPARLEIRALRMTGRALPHRTGPSADECSTRSTLLAAPAKPRSCPRARRHGRRTGNLPTANCVIGKIEHAPRAGRGGDTVRALYKKISILSARDRLRPLAVRTGRGWGRAADTCRGPRPQARAAPGGARGRARSR